jgi:hypothetical protein
MKKPHIYYVLAYYDISNCVAGEMEAEDVGV